MERGNVGHMRAHTSSYYMSRNIFRLRDEVKQNSTALGKRHDGEVVETMVGFFREEGR